MESIRGEKVIVLVDMDCFYVQVEQKICPQYQNRPCAVVQYNTWKGGGIIAVNYEARAQGVSRRGRGEDAQKQCPDIHLFKVPEVRGKADLTRYREAGASVMEVLCKFSDCVERASIDEAYIDLTSVINSRLKTSPVTIDQIPNTFVVGHEDQGDEKGLLQDWLQLIYEEDHLYNDRMLAEAAVIVEEMRSAVYAETGYRCSAGIAHNKMLAKLSCGLHKPNKQTILPESSIPILYNTIPVKKVRNLGGKFGDQVTEKFNAKTMGDLMNLTKSHFVNAFGEKNGSWLYGLSRGIDHEQVTPRQLPKSIGCGKNFPGKSSLSTKEKVLHWVKQLSTELEERLIKDQENNRRAAKLLTISVRNQMTAGFSVVSKSCPIVLYNAEKIAHDAYAAIQKFNTTASSSSEWNPPILSLAMSASKFEDRIDNSMCDIQTYFAKSPTKKKDIPSPDVSNIDTVLQLIEDEPGLSDATCGNSNDKVLEIISKRNSKKGSIDISNFFNTKAPSTSKAEHLLNDKHSNDLSNQNSETSKFSKTEISPIMEHHEEPVLTHSSKEESAVITSDSTNKKSVEKEESCPKVKGFFARKLEEKLKSLAEKAGNAPTSSAKTHEINSFDAVPSTSTVQSDSIASFSPPRQNESGTSSMYSLSDNSELDPDLTNLCSKCNKRIPVWEEEEHADYHFALDISKESNKVQVGNQTNSRNVSSHSSVKNTSGRSSKTRKRGGTSKSTVSAKRTVQQNTIDSFFR